MTKINRVVFFDEVRKTLFLGKIKQSQVKGLDLFITEYENRNLSVQQGAYIFASTHHETGQAWKPVKENELGKGKRYGQNIKYDGTRYFDVSSIFYGRGFTQATWYEIYQKLTLEAKKQGKDWNFLKKPDLLLQYEPSVWATFEGMIKGYYTGAKLSDFVVDAEFRQYFNARRVLNSLDRAGDILIYAELFESALTKATNEP